MKRTKGTGVADLVSLISDGVSLCSQGLTSDAAREDHRVPLYLTGPNEICNLSYGCSTRMETNKQRRDGRGRMLLKFLRKLLNSKSIPTWKGSFESKEIGFSK